MEVAKAASYFPKSNGLQVDGVKFIGQPLHETPVGKEYALSEGQGGLITPDGKLFVWTIPPDRAQDIWQMPEQHGAERLHTFGVISCCALTTQFDGYKLLLHGRYTRQLLRMLQHGLFLATQQGGNIHAIDSVDLYTHNHDPRMNYVGGISSFFEETLGRSVAVGQHGEPLPFHELQAHPMTATV